MNDRTCISYWFPLIESAGLPVPRTITTRIDFSLLPLLGGETPAGFLDFVDRLQGYAVAVGLPAFLRTGHGSGKHQFRECCFVGSINCIPQRVLNLVEWSECVDFMGLPTNVWAVREYLPVHPLYHCTRFGGMPVVKELRLFVDGANVVYEAPYWPADALRQGEPDDPAWEESYAADHTWTGADLDEARRLASAAGAACGGIWSVDVLTTERGLYVTDMAEAERSYGYKPELFGGSRRLTK